MTATTPEPARPPDHPAVPRAPRSALAIVVSVYCIAIVGLYLVFAFTQRELGEPERDDIPASVKSSPGGYRSYAFWHTGYHGGK